MSRLFFNKSLPAIITYSYLFIFNIQFKSKYCSEWAALVEVSLSECFLFLLYAVFCLFSGALGFLLYQWFVISYYMQFCLKLYCMLSLGCGIAVWTEVQVAKLVSQEDPFSFKALVPAGWGCHSYAGFCMSSSVFCICFTDLDILPLLSVCPF